MPLAAAAVVGVIVIGVLPLAPSIVDDTPQRATDMPAESTRSMALTPAHAPPNAAPAQPTEAAALTACRRREHARRFECIGGPANLRAAAFARRRGTAAYGRPSARGYRTTRRCWD
jgi:hypothetical protein